MYLVDTSVWIEYLRGVDSPVVEFLDKLLTSSAAAGISDLIYLEILQGARSEGGFKKLRKYFSTQRFFGFQAPRQSYEKAAYTWFSCRRLGLTVRSSIDCLIAQCAVENGLVLLHHDRDYTKLGKVLPGLLQKHFL